MGQTILEIGPRWHKNKEGTPTMGGLFFIGGILLSLLSMGLPYCVKSGNWTLFKIFGMMLLFGAVGFIDDFVKFVKKRNKGLTMMQKLVFQFAIASLFLYSMKGSLTTSLILPFVNAKLELGIFYWVFALFFIVYMTNAVNITDGIDGLAASVTMVAFVFFAAVAVLSKITGLVVISGAVIGAMIGFLIYNIHPARVFMGDTGSLFLGGAVCGAAFWLNRPLLIVIVGIIYLWEALSVVLQVISFRLTRKRIFRMAPFHHHLEMTGWQENRIVAVFCLITAFSSVLAYLMFFV